MFLQLNLPDQTQQPVQGPLNLVAQILLPLHFGCLYLLVTPVSLPLILLDHHQTNLATSFLPADPPGLATLEAVAATKGHD